MSRLSTETFDLAVGDRFSDVRGKLNFTQRQFAEALGVSDKAIANWERGVRELPSSVAAQLSIKYDIDANWLLTGVGSQTVAAREVNSDILEQVIISVDTLLEKRGRQLPRERKAKLVAYVYRLWASGRKLDDELLDGFLEIAA
jgi:transcriptional regulator with XRE-family HTH domain